MTSKNVGLNSTYSHFKANFDAKDNNLTFGSEKTLLFQNNTTDDFFWYFL